MRMKKNLAVFFVLAFVFMGAFGSVSSAHASVVCDSPDHAIWSQDSSTKVGCIPDPAWQSAIAFQWGGQIVHVKPGESVKLIYGFVDTCPLYIWQGCVISTNLIAK